MSARLYPLRSLGLFSIRIVSRSMHSHWLVCFGSREDAAFGSCDDDDDDDDANERSRTGDEKMRGRK